MENTIQDDNITPEWLFKEEQGPIKNKIKKVCNTKTIKQIARENILKNVKERDKEVTKKRINPFYFIEENLKIGLSITHTNCILSIIPIFPDFGIETSFINENLKETATIYTRLINQ